MSSDKHSQMRYSGPATTPRIGLLHHLGFGNLGDEATLDAVLRNVRSRWPHAEIIAFSMNPSDTETRHGITSYALRPCWRSHPVASTPRPSPSKVKNQIKQRLREYRALRALLRGIKTITVRLPLALFRELSFLAESFSIVRGIDLLVVSGGGQLLDSWGGTWAFPYTLFRWVWLAKLARVKCYFINVGAGPLDRSLSKWFVKRSLGAAEYISFRDGDSRDLVQRIGFRGNSEVSVDSAYSFDLSGRYSPAARAGQESIVGLSPMAYCDPRHYWDKNQSAYEGYMRKLASFGAWLVQNQHGLNIFSTETSFDAHAIEDLTKTLSADIDRGGADSVVVHPVTNFSDLVSAICASDYVVTSRYHGVVWAHLLNKPVLAISHHRKVATLMNDLGLSEYCVDIRTFDLDLLTHAFTRLIENRDAVKARMADEACRYEKALTIQFDRLFPREAIAKG